MKYILLIIFLIASQVSLAAPYSTRMMSRNSMDNGNVTQDIGPPLSAGVIGYDIPNNAPFWVTLGSGLAFTSGVLDVTKIPVNADWNSSSGLSQILNKPIIPVIPSNISAFVNDSGYINQAGARSSFSLTTTGTGAATYSVSTGVLNVPLPVATTLPSQALATRALNTAFQISPSRGSIVSYSVQITVTSSISSGQNGDVVLEIASNSGFTANVQTLAIAGNGQTYSLAIAIQGVQPTTNVLSGFVPAGYYARLRTVNNIGTPTFSYRGGQEVLF